MLMLLLAGTYSSEFVASSDICRLGSYGGEDSPLDISRVSQSHKDKRCLSYMQPIGYVRR